MNQFRLKEQINYVEHASRLQYQAAAGLRPSLMWLNQGLNTLYTQHTNTSHVASQIQCYFSNCTCSGYKWIYTVNMN